MSKSIQAQASTSIVARTVQAIRRLGRDRRGAELVEVLVVIAIFALGGIAAMTTLAGKVDQAAGKTGDKVINLEKPAAQK